MSGEMVWEFQLTESSGYSMDDDYFHSFVCVDEFDTEEMWGLSFADGTVGKAAGMIILQLIPHARDLATPDVEARSDVDQGEAPPLASQGGKKVWKNIRRFFSSRRQSGGGAGKAAEREQRKLEISAPSNFQHISHGGGAIMYSSTQPVQPRPSGAEPTLPSAGRKGRKRQASQDDPPSKKKRVEISGPQDFKHVSHVGVENFGLLDKAETYTVQGGGAIVEEVGGEEAVDKRASSLRPPSGVSREISEPFDVKHVAHVDKSDPLVQLLTSQQTKSPFGGSAAVAASDTAPKFPELIKPMSGNGDNQLTPADCGGSLSSEPVGSDITEPQASAHKPEVAVQSSLEEIGQPGMECGPVLSQSRASLLSQTSSGAWSEVSQGSSGGDTVRQSSAEGPPSPGQGEQEGTANTQTTDRACQTEAASPPPPPPPPPPPVPVTPTDRLPPIQFDHDSFIQEIEGFDPSQLRSAEDRELPRAPPSHRLSMQTLMRSSFDKMKEKLHSVWRESVFAYIAEEDEFGEEEFDFGQLI